jgi:hypothetical protein
VARQIERQLAKKKSPQRPQTMERMIASTIFAKAQVSTPQPRQKGRTDSPLALENSKSDLVWPIHWGALEGSKSYFAASLLDDWHPKLPMLLLWKNYLQY